MIDQLSGERPRPKGRYAQFPWKPNTPSENLESTKPGSNLCQPMEIPSSKVFSAKNFVVSSSFKP